MPTYEYECQKCKKNFDLFQSMRDEALQTCPKTHCRMRVWGKGKIRRLLGAGAGLIFKGSGFYTTDYRSEGYKESAKKESLPPEKKDSSKKETTKEASPKKPAVKKTSQGK